MAGTYLLDTNAVIARIAADDQIAGLLETADEIFLSTISLGELYFGAEKSSRVEANLKQVLDFTKGRMIVTPDDRTSQMFGKIKQQLRLKGRPIPDHDIWIAALAMQHDLTLLTLDAHFNEVEGLMLAGW